MRLSQLAARPVAADVEIAGLTADSRAVRPGFLFAALSGSKLDGSAFIADALAKGAAAVLGVAGTQAPVPVIESAEPRRDLAMMAARFYGMQPSRIAAVTGTNGKTSVAVFTRQIWSAAGRRAASLGTIGLVAPGLPAEETLTTPEPVELHRRLADLARAGIDHLAIEASSHGLDQHRLDGLELAAAAFTNLARDHLDYHPTMEAYLGAKAGLFTRLLPADGTAVLNRNSDRFAELAPLVRQRMVTYGGPVGAPEADLAILERTALADGQDLVLSLFGTRHSLRLPLIGGFQAENALAALGLATATGVTVEAAARALETLETVPGRMQRVARGIYVDYAHKPGALEAVLTAMRPHVEGKLIVVFGCGGDRDTGKRPMMGEIAGRLADRVIVTDDNPRTEDPAAIRTAILAAVPEATEIGDRAEAIAAAISEMREGDILVVAGKGHEPYQIVGTEKHPFDDAAVIRSLVNGRAA